MNNKRLLVATDLSDASDKCLECAVALAKLTNSEIILLHIFELSDVDEYAKQMMASNFLSRDIKRQLQNTTTEITEKYGIKAQSLTKDGELFSLLAEAADETKSDILYIGTHGVHGVQHLIGSFLAKTIDSLNLPVWVVQKQTTVKAYKNIFVYIDEFPGESLHTLTIELAQLYNAPLHFVFTESENGFAVSEMLIKIKNTLTSKSIAFTFHHLDEISDKPHQLIEIAALKEDPLIIINRDGKGAEKHIPVLTNKHHIEVLCLY